ncbi:MAG: hypothetical protein JSU68_14710 [Phycisphaerales bacterium]|nr:MAG: hypothetical protein JSU68_14710 [Phycisphaerales bacterium]
MTGHSSRSENPPARPRPSYALALLAVLLIAALLRLYQFDLIEFKTDEAMICDITIDMLESGRPATHGLLSGKGITNFPMFACLLAGPMMLSRDPSFLTALITLSNLVAIGLLFHYAATRWGWPVALWAALLMAASPWAVLYSRKIWAQNVLPVLIVPALFSLMRLLDGEKRSTFWLVLLTGIAAMTHLSGFCAIAASLVVLAVFRPSIDWKHAGLAMAVLVVLAGPYLYYLATEGATDRQRAVEYLKGEGTPAAYKPSLNQIAATGLNIINDYGFDHVLGSPPEGPPPVYGSQRPGSIVGRIVAVAAVLTLLVRAAVDTRRRSGTPGARDIRRSRAVLLIWLATPLVMYRLAGIRVHTHYFIVIMPVLFLAIGIALEDLRRSAANLRWTLPRNLLQALPIALGLGIACSGVASNWRFHRIIESNGGAPGGYEVALRYKQAAVLHIVAQAGDHPVALVGDTVARTPQPGAEDYEYLLRLARRRAGYADDSTTSPRRDFVIVDPYRYNLSPAEFQMLARYAPRQFGPVLVCALPEQDTSRTHDPALGVENR